MTAYRSTKWGKKFFQALEIFIAPARLARGWPYRTDHRILTFTIIENTIKAQVRGNINPYFGVHLEPTYHVELIFKKIPADQWEKSIEKICQYPEYLSKMMCNDIPDNIDLIFEPFHFLPRSHQDIKSTCSCPENNPACKHIVGVYYRIATLMDINPMLLFLLRGIDMETFHQLLKKTSLGCAFSEYLLLPINLDMVSDLSFYPWIEQLPDGKNSSLLAFWGDEQRIDSHQFKHTGKKQYLTAALIKKQGDYPDFWKKSGSFINGMEQIYQLIKRQHKASLGDLN